MCSYAWSVCIRDILHSEPECHVLKPPMKRCSTHGVFVCEVFCILSICVYVCELTIALSYHLSQKCRRPLCWQVKRRVIMNMRHECPIWHIYHYEFAASAQLPSLSILVWNREWHFCKGPFINSVTRYGRGGGKFWKDISVTLAFRSFFGSRKIP